MFYQKKKKNREQGGEKITKEMIHENLSEMRKVRGPLCIQHNEQQKQRYSTLNSACQRQREAQNPLKRTKKTRAKGQKSEQH